MLRKMPLRLTRVEFEDDFAGWAAIVRQNITMSTAEKFESGKLSAIREGLLQIILAWNFVDESGESIGKPLDDEEAKTQIVQWFGRDSVARIIEAIPPEERNGYTFLTQDSIGKLPIDLLMLVAEVVTDAISKNPLRVKNKS